MKKRVQIVAGDSAASIFFTLRDRLVARSGSRLDRLDPDTWLNVNLGKLASIKATVRKTGIVPGAPVHLPVIRLRPYESGLCVLNWSAEVFADPGLYEAEITLTRPDETIETCVERLIVEARGRMS